MMPQIKLSKSALSQEQKKLGNYRQFLPSLDLKRLKLMAEKNKADIAMKRVQSDIVAIENEIRDKLPMISVSAVKTENLVNIESIVVGEENIVGVRLPVLQDLKFGVVSYSYFNSPHWLDDYIKNIKIFVETKIRFSIAAMRLKRLDDSLRMITQRKNLFEKVLIPRSMDAIRIIRIFLADNERAAVMRSKMAKKKRLEE